MKITLTLNKRQLDVLLSTIESTLHSGLPGSGYTRGMSLLQAANEGNPTEYAYDVAKLAPIYTELLKHWKGLDTPAGQAMNGEDQVRWGRRDRQRKAIERVLKAATEMAMTA